MWHGAAAGGAWCHGRARPGSRRDPLAGRSRAGAGCRGIPAGQRRAGGPAPVAAAGVGGARGWRDHLGRGGWPAHPGRVGGRAGPARLPLVRAGSGLRGHLADRLRAEPAAAAARGRAPGRLRLGDGDHLRRERAVDVGAVRGRAAGRGLLLPAVPAPRPGSGAHRLGARGVGHRVLHRAGAGAGRGRARGRHAAGQRGRLRRGRHLRAARGDRAAGPALPAGAGGHQPAPGWCRTPGPAGGAQAGRRPGRAGGVPHPARQHQARLAQLRRSVRAGGGELAGRLRLPRLRDPGTGLPVRWSAAPGPCPAGSAWWR